MKNIFKEHLVNSEQEMLKLGNNFAQTIKYSGTVILSGSLGTGKTVFSRGIINGLSKKVIVNSPTFTLINEYLINKYLIYHLDLYRLNDNFTDIPIFEILEKKNALVLIEWGEKLEKFLKRYFLINFEYINDEKRKIKIEKINC